MNIVEEASKASNKFEIDIIESMKKVDLHGLTWNMMIIDYDIYLQ